MERKKFYRGLNEVLLSANIAIAVGYALSVYLARGFATWPPQNDSGYYFLRGAVRVSDLLHQGATNAVSTDGVARTGLPIQWNRLAIETTFVISLISVAALVLLLVRVCVRGSSDTVMFRRIAAAVAVFAAPLGCLLALKLTWDWPSSFEPAALPLERVLAFAVFAGELLGFFVLLLVHRKRAVSRWVSPTLLLLHFVFWGWFLLPNLLLHLRGSPALDLFHLALWFVPSAGALVLLYVGSGDKESTADVDAPGLGNWTLAGAVLALAALLVIWMPMIHPSMPPKDLKSVVVELSRGTCFGSCPAYTIIIHGDGTVEYEGKAFVKVAGRQTSTLSSEKLAEVLQRLDQAQFFALDDRAFAWCFDTPSVSVKVFMDGRTKRVSSDAGCAGAKPGLQDAFVQAVDDIDKIVGSERWVRCQGSCRI
jgi:Domain of unknown function (DUF6438)